MPACALQNHFTAHLLITWMCIACIAIHLIRMEFVFVRLDNQMKCLCLLSLSLSLSSFHFLFLSLLLSFFLRLPSSSIVRILMFFRTEKLPQVAHAYMLIVSIALPANYRRCLLESTKNAFEACLLLCHAHEYCFGLLACVSFSFVDVSEYGIFMCTLLHSYGFTWIFCTFLLLLLYFSSLGVFGWRSFFGLVENVC